MNKLLDIVAMCNMIFRRFSTVSGG